MPRRSKTPVGDPRCAIAYLRKSKDDPQNNFDVQRDAITAWAATRGVLVLTWHTDEGISGDAMPADRPGLLQALDALREHGAAWLVAAKIDRISRDVVVGAIVEREAERAGACMATADGVDPSSTPQGNLIRNLLRSVAQFDLEMIRLRTREKLQAKRARCEKTGGHAPYGYKGVRDARGVLVLQPDPLEQSALRTMRRLRAEGRTLEQIAASLDGKYTPRGKRWHASGVLRALRADEQRNASTQA